MAGEVIDPCSFETVRTENLGFCPNEESVGGVKVTAFYIPMAQLATVTKPTIDVSTSFTNSVILSALTPATGKGFKKIDLVTDEGELKTNLVGNKGNLKDQAQFDGVIPNFTKKNIGFIKRHKNTPMCWVIVDSTGQKWVVLDSFITKGDATTGKKYEDVSGTTFNITANGPLWAFAGDIVELAD